MNSFAQGLNIGRIRYEVQKDEETLESIFKKFLKDGRVLKKDGEFYRLNQERNLQVNDWQDLEEGDVIDVYLPASFIDKEKFKEYVAYKKALDEERRLQKLADARWNRSVFYMASFGRFNQTEGAIDIKFQQNSPVTLGYATSYKLSPEWSVSGSAYFSYLLAADSVLNTEKVSIRPEIGFNGYLARRLTHFNVYGGVDFERFTTFDIDTIISSQQVSRDESRVWFATIGIDKYLKNNRRGLLLRASLSTALSSTRISYESGESLDRPFTGLKLMLYANAPIDEKYFMHFLFKQHLMSGAGDLSVNRIGVGFGYKF